MQRQSPSLAIRSVRLVAFAVAVTACEGGTSPPPAAPPEPPYGYATYGQPAPYGYTPRPSGSYGAPPPQSYPGYGQPAPAPASAPYASPVPSTPLPSGPDPITTTNIVWLRAHTASLMQELVAALPDVARARVQSIPLAIDDTPGDVNAFAACNAGKAVMVVTDGLLDVTAHLSQAKANDDVFRTRTVDAYIAFIAQAQKPDQPVPEPPPGFFDAAQQTDPRRVARQHDVLDETLGFILGHELAHHHLGHLPCTGGAGPLGMGELVRGIASSAPIFNQPNEIAADTAGTDTILTAGARRPGYHLTEEGGLLIMQFFSATDQLSPEDVLFAFDRTHPPPALRIPVIQQTANLWRATGGAWVPLPRF